ncbi:MAG: hypothetical protein DSO03_02560, partial [Hadesarchaea archaeon]
IDPDTFNLRSQGRWITVYIELPHGYDLESVDVGTIRLEGVSAEPHPIELGDHDGDGVPDLMVKFDRSAVQSLLEPGEKELTVTGNWHAVLFKGSDVIRVIELDKDGKKVPLGRSGEHPGQSGQGSSRGEKRKPKAH